MNKFICITIIIVVCTLCIVYSCKRDAKVLTYNALAICGVGCDTITFEPVTPSDVKILSQQCANTFAWQSFIALTWPADATHAGLPDTLKNVSHWGKPGDLTPMTFDTFKSPEEVFTNTAPALWGSNQYGIMHEADDSTDCKRKISRIHKLEDADIISELFQAGGRTLWLTDQLGNLVWYDIKMNKKEFDYIVHNEFYNRAAQTEYLSNNPGSAIWLPFGSIELKSSWRIIPKHQFHELKKRYKIIQASVPTTVTIINDTPHFGKFEEQYLGLVGLHIIQKTPSAPQFIWATFEHEDLAPLGNTCNTSNPWLLYNADSCTLTPNVHPKGSNLKKPIQVVKDSAAAVNNEAAALNKLIHQRLKALNPESVFQYYHLVDSQWPSSAVADRDNGPYTPLTNGGKTPFVLTNVSMETYVQDMSCLSCHVGAGIKKDHGDGKEYATDYSFLLNMAKKKK